ncbi:MAG: WecB/TagA/CpsF family glycosyltransferase [Clostridiaceae bacterium]|jgi:N-acetylglucosaminyldiphosphoundecaprenol N-acetyl-beta-D-mannosaminyltransferase|nr:WecB/TagA/CpsF family glycosyltransferase [Clostridiaceae bacterium]
MDRVNIHGVKIHNTTMQEAVETVLHWVAGDTIHAVYTPNSEIIMQAQRNPELKNVLNEAGLLVPDGAGLILGARVLKTPLKEKVSGIDLVKNLFLASRGKNTGFYILGGQPGVAEMAAVNIVSKYGKINIKGYAHGYFTAEEESSVIENINKAKPDILLVGLGAPRQEFWIHQNMYRLNCKVCIGVGGSIDILAGTAILAPEFMRKAGLEWLFRLIREPKRYKRMLDLPRFVFLTYKTRFFK